MYSCQILRLQDFLFINISEGNNQYLRFYRDSNQGKFGWLGMTRHAKSHSGMPGLTRGEFLSSRSGMATLEVILNVQ